MKEKSFHILFFNIKENHVFLLLRVLSIPEKLLDLIVVYAPHSALTLQEVSNKLVVQIP